MNEKHLLASTQVHLNAIECAISEVTFGVEYNFWGQLINVRTHFFGQYSREWSPQHIWTQRQSARAMAEQKLLGRLSLTSFKKVASK